MIPLLAQIRPLKPSASALRREGLVPCVLYGYETMNTLLSCKEVPLQKTWTAAGKSTLVEIDIGKRKIPVLFYDVSYHPVTDRIAHVDFYAVNMKEEVAAEVPIHFTDLAPATKEAGVILVTPVTHVTVRALPANLPHALTVSLSSLEKIHDALHVRDIPLPNGVTILEDAETVIALAQEQRIEQEPVPVAAVEAVEGAAIPEGTEGAPPPESPNVESKEKKPAESKEKKPK